MFCSSAAGLSCHNTPVSHAASHTSWSLVSTEQGSDRSILTKTAIQQARFKPGHFEALGDDELQQLQQDLSPLASEQLRCAPCDCTSVYTCHHGGWLGPGSVCMPDDGDGRTAATVQVVLVCLNLHMATHPAVHVARPVHGGGVRLRKSYMSLTVAAVLSCICRYALGTAGVVAENLLISRTTSPNGQVCFSLHATTPSIM